MGKMIITISQDDLRKIIIEFVEKELNIEFNPDTMQIEIPFE